MIYTYSIQKVQSDLLPYLLAMNSLDPPVRIKPLRLSGLILLIPWDAPPSSTPPWNHSAFFWLTRKPLKSNLYLQPNPPKKNGGGGGGIVSFSSPQKISPPPPHKNKWIFESSFSNLSDIFTKEEHCVMGPSSPFMDLMGCWAFFFRRSFVFCRS